MDFETFMRCTEYLSTGIILLAPGITFLWNKNVTRYTPYLYLAMAFNGVMRVFYVMVTKGEVALMYINGGGVLLELASAAERRRANLLRSIVPGLLILILGGICYLTSATAYRLLSAICGSALYVVPMIDVVKVIKLRKRKHMPPLLLASASFLNGIAWAVISGIQSDGYIMVPNLAGLACACIQLGLHIGASWLFKVHFSGLTELFLEEEEEEESLCRSICMTYVSTILNIEYIAFHPR